MHQQKHTLWFIGILKFYKLAEKSEVDPYVDMESISRKYLKITMQRV